MKNVQQEYEEAVPVALLQEHPDNPRRGNDDALRSSVDALGFYGAVVVQRSTNRVLAGNTRLRVARAESAQTIPVVWVDVDDVTAKKILLADNRVSDYAFYDNAALLELLVDVNTTADLLGTGYHADDLNALLNSTQVSGDLVNVKRALMPDEMIEKYEESQIRTLIMPFDRDMYVHVVEALAQIRKELGMDTNSEVLVFLLEEYGSTPEPEES